MKYHDCKTENTPSLYRDKRRIKLGSRPIDFLAMAYSHDEDNKLCVLHFVDDAIVPNLGEKLISLILCGKLPTLSNLRRSLLNRLRSILKTSNKTDYSLFHPINAFV
jgi:hypothetical protein